MNIIQELYRMKASGYTAQDAYILVKDYIELEEFITLYEGAK